MKSPCLTCPIHLRGGDKGCQECSDCVKRVAYDRQSRHLWEAPKAADMRGNILALPHAAPRTPIRPEVGLKEERVVETKTKVCTRKDCVHAGAPQPLDNFDSITKSPDGRACYCKDCRRRIQRDAERRKGRKPRPSEPAADKRADVKTCIKCSLSKPLADFPLNKLVNGGRENTCKKCREDYRRSLRAGIRKQLPAPIAPAPEVAGPAVAHREIYLAAAVRIRSAAPATPLGDGATDERAAELLRILYPSGIAPEMYADLSRVVRIVDHLICIADLAAESKEAPHVDPRS